MQRTAATATAEDALIAAMLTLGRRTRLRDLLDRFTSDLGAGADEPSA